MICKQKLAELTKCYCVAGFDDDTGTHILVASEKDYPCYMFSLQGEREETLWETPGGVMSMVQVPGVKDCLLATGSFIPPTIPKMRISPPFIGKAPGGKSIPYAPYPTSIVLISSPLGIPYTFLRLPCFPGGT